MLMINVAPIPVSVTQVMIGSIPIVVLLGYFVLIAYRRPREDCYNGSARGIDGGAPEECALVPLEELLIIDVVICFLFLSQALYATFFVGWRQNLMNNYLLNGKTVLGDVHYDPNQNVCGGVPLVHFGVVVYPHPTTTHLDEEPPKFVRRKVRVFERYTRERTTLLYLERLPFSAQPKVDLEADLKKLQEQRENLTSIGHYAFLIAFLCFAALAYVLKVLWDMDQFGIEEWQPDYGAFRTVLIYTIVAVSIPVAAFLFNWMMWFRYKWWMTRTHRILSEHGKDSEEYRPKWFKSPRDCESATYTPPVSSKTVEMKELQ